MPTTSINKMIACVRWAALSGSATAKVATGRARADCLTVTCVLDTMSTRGYDSG
jgi:hypothetical protein